jgi:hypothetical protein
VGEGSPVPIGLGGETSHLKRREGESLVEGGDGPVQDADRAEGMLPDEEHLEWLRALRTSGVRHGENPLGDQLRELVWDYVEAAISEDIANLVREAFPRGGPDSQEISEMVKKLEAALQTIVDEVEAFIVAILQRSSRPERPSS